MQRAVVALVLVSILGINPLGWDPFGPLRWMAISTLALVAFGLATKRTLFKIERVSSVLWSGLLGVMLLSSLVGLDPLYAFTGTPDRHLGLFSWVLFAGVFIVGQQLVDLVSLQRGVTAAAFGLGLYTIAEQFDSALVAASFAGDRLGGTFGQPAYLGAASVLLLPLCIGHAMTRSETDYWRVNAITSAAFMLFTLFASQTRGAILGALFVLAWLVFRYRERIGRKHAVGLGALMVLVLLLLVFPLSARISGAGDAVEGRLAEWAVATRVIAERPLLGTGPEGYRIAFIEEVDAGYERRYGRATNPDRAHNGLLDVGVSTGVFGMLIYASLLSLIALSALQTSKAATPWMWGVSAALLGYLVQQMLLFPLAELDPVFWLLAGVMIGGGVRKSIEVRVPRVVPAGAAVLATGVFVFGAVDVVADYKIADAFEAFDERAALQQAETAVALRPDSIRYEFLASSFALIAGDHEASLSHIDAALDLSPNDPILASRRAELLLARAQATAIDAHLLTAVEALAERVDRDPNNAALHLDYGVALALVGDFDSAEQQWLMAVDLAPGWNDPVVNLEQLERSIDS